MPIGMLWIRLSDIAEEIRRKKIETEFNSAGWVSASETMDIGRSQQRSDLQFNPPPGQMGHQAGANASGGFGAAGSDNQAGPVIESWFSLEPVGRIHLAMTFGMYR